MCLEDTRCYIYIHVETHEYLLWEFTLIPTFSAELTLSPNLRNFVTGFVNATVHTHGFWQLPTGSAGCILTIKCGATRKRRRLPSATKSTTHDII